MSSILWALAPRAGGAGKRRQQKQALDKLDLGENGTMLPRRFRCSGPAACATRRLASERRGNYTPRLTRDMCGMIKPAREIISVFRQVNACAQVSTPALS